MEQIYAFGNSRKSYPFKQDDLRTEHYQMNFHRIIFGAYGLRFIPEKFYMCIRKDLRRLFRDNGISPDKYPLCGSFITIPCIADDPLRIFFPDIPAVLRNIRIADESVYIHLIDGFPAVNEMIRRIGVKETFRHG